MVDFIVPNQGDLAKFLSNGEETETTTAEPQPETVEKTKEEQAPSQEEQKPVEAPAELENVPFNRHPRWKRMEKDLAQAREDARLAREAAQSKPEVKQENVEQEVPQEFSELFGKNPEAWKLYDRMLQARDAKVLAQAEEKFKNFISEQQNEQQKAADAQQKVVDFAENEFIDLSDDAGVDLTDRNNTVRNQILDIIDENELYDAEGKPNIRAAFKLHARLYPKAVDPIEEKRKIVSKTNSKTNSSAKESDIMTSSKLKEIERRGGLQWLLKQ